MADEFDGIDLSGGSAGNFDLSNFDGIDLGGGSAGNFDLSSLLADLSNIGTNLGPTSNMGMDKDLLAQLGLSDLVGGDTGGATRSLSGVDLSGGSDTASLEDFLKSLSSNKDGAVDLKSLTQMSGTNKTGMVGPSLSETSTKDAGSVVDVLTPAQREALNLPITNNSDTASVEDFLKSLSVNKDKPIDLSSLTQTPAGIDPTTGTGLGSMSSIASQGANMDYLNGGQGLTSYIPAQYGSDGTQIKGTGGTLTQSGFVPDNSQVALGGDSLINNPKVTGKTQVTTNGTSTYNPKTDQITTTSVGKDGLTTTVVKDGTTGKVIDTKTTVDDKKVVTPTTVTPKVTTPTSTKSGMDPMMMMLLMYLMSQMGKSGGSSGTQASIPQLQANQRMLPYTAPSRPGAGGQTYFSPQTYTPKASGGMIGYADGGGISTLGGYSDGGRLLRGPGDGVSDNIPATIAGKQPARLADGEFVVPARIVSELGNGSTDAGAKRLYEMMDRVQKARRKTKNVAADTKAAKYLPA